MLDGWCHGTNDYTFLGSGVTETMRNAAFKKVSFPRPQHPGFSAYRQFNSSTHHNTTFVPGMPVGFQRSTGTDFVVLIKQLQRLTLEICANLFERNAISTHFDKLILAEKWLVQEHLVLGKKLRKRHRKNVEDFPEGAHRRAGIVALRLGDGAVCQSGFLGQLTLRIAKEFSQLPYSGAYVEGIDSGLIA